MSILIVASENRAEIGEIHVFAVAAHVLCLDISVQTVNHVHFFQTIEQLNRDVGYNGLKKLARLQFPFDVLIDRERKILHNEETTALNRCVMLVPRAFCQLRGEFSKEQALCEHVGGSRWKRIKLNRILQPRTLFLKDAHSLTYT